MRRIAPLLLVAALLTACGGEPSASPASTAPRGDPALRVSAAIIALERGGEAALSVEQARKILPLLKVLRDTPAEDRAAAQALADEVLAVLTPAQRAAIERMRERAQEGAGQRRPGGGQGGPPGGDPGAGRPGAGPPGGEPQGGPPRGPRVGQGGGGPDPARRAEFRRRAIDRAIRLLEAKIP